MASCGKGPEHLHVARLYRTIHSSHIELTIDGKPASNRPSGLTVPANIESERKKGPLKPFLKLQTKIHPCSRELAYDEDL